MVWPMTGRTIAAGLGALALIAVASVGIYTVISRPPPSVSLQLPTATSLVAKLDSVENPHLSADVRARDVSGIGPAPQKMDPRGTPPSLTVTNNVIEVAQDGPNRLTVTRIIRYDFPDGEDIETEPAKVPFVLESDGEWRVDREYLCEQVEAMETTIWESGRTVKPDPGCV